MWASGQTGNGTLRNAALRGEVLLSNVPTFPRPTQTMRDRHHAAMSG
jgi:hypothetical protein